KSVDESNNTTDDDVLISTGSAVLTIPNVQVSDEGFYYCVVTNGSPIEVQSNVAGLKLKQLLAWYQFENNGQDSAGANHASPIPSMSYAEGIVTANGQAYAAEPNSANYFALMTDSYPKTGFGNGLTHFTYSCWVKLDSGQGGVLLGTLNTGTNTGLRFSVNTSDGSISCFLRQNGNVSRFINIHNLPIADSGWHWVTVTNNGSQLVVYFDGLAQGNAAFDLTNFVAWEYPVYMLAINSRGAADQRFQGKADDLRIYNYALSADEIIQAYYDVTGKKVCVDKPAMDLNNNCVVDMADLAMLAASWLESGLRPID
ncbi:MAG: LamG-like jellyroll fold domain-containing protein, partial [Anaerohalosphaeraceae bacterium]